MNPDLYLKLFSDIASLTSENSCDDFFKMTENIHINSNLKEYILALDELERSMGKIDNKKKNSLKGLIELYLNCLLLGYQNKLSVEEREYFLHQIKSKLESESNHYSDKEIKLFFDINYLEKILFSLNLDESVEFLEVITGKLLKVIVSNKIEYTNPNEKILTDDLLNSLIAYY